MYNVIKNDVLLKNYNQIWGKVSKVIKNWFDSEPVYNDKYLKTKSNSYEGNFHKFSQIEHTFLWQ